MESSPVDSQSNGAKARKLAVKKATEAISDLIAESQKAGMPANYVLFDSWFSSPKVICAPNGVRSLSYYRQMRKDLVY